MSRYTVVVATIAVVAIVGAATAIAWWVRDAARIKDDRADRSPDEVKARLRNGLEVTGWVVAEIDDRERGPERGYAFKAAKGPYAAEVLFWSINPNGAVVYILPKPAGDAGAVVRVEFRFDHKDRVVSSKPTTGKGDITDPDDPPPELSPDERARMTALATELKRIIRAAVE